MKYVYKKTVIKALETEPLAHGMYFQDESDTKCGVCAVGAVLRQTNNEGRGPCSVGVPGYDSFDTNSTKYYLKAGRHLRALDSFFESLGNGSIRPATEKQRQKCIEFVEKNFPNRVILSETEGA